MATLTTGEDGKATTPELYLGTYTVCEAKAKDGYALDVVEKTVALEYAGQEVADLRPRGGRYRRAYQS